MPPSKITRSALAAIVAVLLATGCSSTLTAERTAGADGVAGTESSTPGGPGAQEAPELQVGGVGATIGAGPGSVAQGGSAAAYELGVPGLTQGITDTTIRIGVPTIANAEAVTGLLGAADLSIGNPQIEVDALVRDLNARGGVHGRTITPIYAPVDFGAADIESSYLAACNKLTDDEHVFAILLVVNPPPSFTACAASHGTVLINNSAAPGDDAIAASAAPWYFAPGLQSLSKVPPALVDDSIKRGTMQAGDKVGIFAIDLPHFTRPVERSLIPALERRGVEVASYERVASEASIQNAVLRFRQAGVTHVMFMQESAIPVLLFLRQAEAQAFRPRYLLSSNDSPGYLLEGNVADAQLRNISGIGWNPTSDVDASQHPTSPLEARCLDLITRGGEPSPTRQSNLSATLMCELVWSFEAIAGRAGPQLSSRSFGAAFAGIGTAYQPVTVFQTNWTAEDPYGVSAYRPLAYVAACSCLRYVGGQEPFP
ncbi:MAG: ABC transporter substrate-binding protein [Actinomycetota bacterium]|nr:ABC transporter substrate-binding protein [Actinomycetota bacterium]